MRRCLPPAVDRTHVGDMQGDEQQEGDEGVDQTQSGDEAAAGAGEALAEGGDEADVEAKQHLLHERETRSRRHQPELSEEAR